MCTQIVTTRTQLITQYMYTQLVVTQTQSCVTIKMFTNCDDADTIRYDNSDDSDTSRVPINVYTTCDDIDTAWTSSLPGRTLEDCEPTTRTPPGWLRVVASTPSSTSTAVTQGKYQHVSI